MKDLGKENSIAYKGASYNNMLCTIFLLISIYTRYDLKLKWEIRNKVYTPHDTLANTGIWKNCAIELILNAFAPYPFLEGLSYVEEVPDFGASVTYGINDVMSLLCFNRCYLLLRFYLYWTNF